MSRSPARNRRAPDPRQLELFPAGGAVITRPAPLPVPVWDDPVDGFRHTDFIQERADVVVFLYPWDALNAESGESGRHGYEGVRAALLRGLRAMSEAGRTVRERAFTIYIGDCGMGYDQLAVALGTTDGTASRFLAPFLETPCHATTEQGVNGEGGLALPPRFRFDHGHVIEYGDEGEEGGVRLDGPSRGGTGLRLHLRRALPAELAGTRRSLYGALRA